MSGRVLGKGVTALRPGRRRREDHTPDRRGPGRAGGAGKGAESVEKQRQERSQARRRDRWARRRQLRRVSQLKRVQQCGHKIGGPDAGPTLGVITNKDGTRSAAYGGLKHCGSVWTCPVCAVKVATRRADDLAAVMRAVHERGGSAPPRGRPSCAARPRSWRSCGSTSTTTAPLPTAGCSRR